VQFGRPPAETDHQNRDLQLEHRRAGGEPAVSGHGSDGHLVSLIPLYIFIAVEVRGRATFAPELPFDRLIPLQPAWAIVYGSLYLFLILLPSRLSTSHTHSSRH
jgi:hypothetical protein